VIVVDASVLVEYVLRTPTGLRLIERLRHPKERLCAPYLVDLEVAQTVRRWAFASLISGERGGKAMQHLAEVRVRRWSHKPLLPRIWELRHNLTAYDDAYVALAEGLRAPLLTCDRSLAEAPGITCKVELIRS
jgi:predicted nucleic acid-binding protein